MEKAREAGDTVLIVVAHTDDETLGAGGAIARHAEKGENVYAVSMTDGVGARGRQNPESVTMRNDAAMQAADILGFKWIAGSRYPDNQMDSVTLLSVVRTIEEVKRKIQPTIIYTHSAADLNVDHRVVALATLTAFRPQPGETWKEIRAFEVPSATDYGHPDLTGLFQPNLYLSMDATWEKKLSALMAYRSEMRNAPHSRSVEGLKTLAKYRGSQMGVPMAEAFQILRKVIR